MRDGWGGRSSADAVEAHLGYLRGALQLRSDQQPAWDRFAGAVRESAGRMTQSPMQAMSSAEGLDQRLAAHEAALSSRLDAARAVRAALGTLTSALDEAQRRSLDETAAVFIPGTGRMRSGMR
jgi:cell pole-organizing protein PopZ